MNEQNKSEHTSFNFPGAAIVALLLGVFVFKDFVLETSRPPMSDSE